MTLQTVGVSLFGGEMGKREKQKQKHERRNRGRSSFSYLQEDQDFDDTPRLSPSREEPVDDSNAEEEEDDADEATISHENQSHDMPSKFLLYQQSVQSPKGDISYMQKFFLMYVGGRVALHLQEDFCGTAFLSTEWLRSDSRRTAVGLDLDNEALNWCVENNIPSLGADGFSRISLFHGNVLQPLESELVNKDPQKLVSNISLAQNEENMQAAGVLESDDPTSSVAEDYKFTKRNIILPGRDIVCAFNYSCCCLHKRADLVLYFKHARDALSTEGGIFVMDLYGGTSSEHKLRLQRRFPNFTYVWEQAEFDIIQRKTRISLHFHLKEQRKLRHAFSYSWRLWTLPEIKDCLEEAGFRSVHFWVREMPDSSEIMRTEGFGAGKNVKYEEATSFQQQDSWNAYIVGVL